MGYYFDSTGAGHYLDPVTRAFAHVGEAPTSSKIWALGVQGAREFLEEAQKHVPASDVVTEEFEIPGRVTGNVKVVLYKPAGATGNLPAVVYLHGGGWILGSPNTHDRLLRDLTRESGLAFFFVSYTPVPEKVYPAQVEEAWIAVKWLGMHGAEKGLEASKIAIAGDSAGGQLAIATCALVAERGGPKIVYQVLFYPVTDTSQESDTYKAFKTNPGLEPDTLRWMVGAFLPSHNDRLGHLASPLLSSQEQLKRLPPTLVITADIDPLRSEGEAFGARLLEAGVETAMFRALGTLHDFVMLNGLANATSRASIELAALKLRRALGGAAGAGACGAEPQQNAVD
ncbi:MAG: hypothetical protein M1839_002614 [Geoglossum umbratile]|nr:MAG: hypothetical protein M1839_002614 [Geoglossum umbratile]